jgi:hypothetical protein
MGGGARIIPALLEGMLYTDADVAQFEAEEEDTGPEDIRPYIHQSKRGGGDDEDPSDWNLRKCSAAALDIFSVELGPAILSVLLSNLQRALEEEVPWELRESAILALGAIADGCGPELEPHLPKLVPYLLAQANHPKVSRFTLWT